MNRVSFAAKRAHLDLMLLNRGALAPLGITPARLDMMQAIRARFDGCQTQGQLAALLGVARQTVARMSRSLEALGLVVCERTAPDLRRVYIMLTDAGRELLERVHRIYLRSGLAGLAAVFALRDGARQPEKATRFVDMARDIRDSLSKWAPFTPEGVAPESWDDGKPLQGADQRVFRNVTLWLYGHFRALPFDYLLANTPPFRD
ncbi:MAG: winged helix-turn-helix transcriptional regulator [Myxococcales bacterium]|jgi:DNA-binding MarR family transcriptional regulator|nr:winged helix-turn-helix transcriptional regulator [Myxococcales bacterium]